MTIHSLDLDGFSLAIETFEPPARPIGVALCGHAMMADRRTLDRPRGEGLCSQLAAAGILTYAYDCRGHGAANRQVAGGASWGYDEIVTRDLPALVAWVSARHPDLPFALVGHSLTAHAGLFLLGLEAFREAMAPVRAFVAFGANLWRAADEPNPLLWQAKATTMRLWRSVARAVGYFPARRLGVGSNDEPLRYVSDLTRFALTGQALGEGGVDYFAGLPAISVPVLSFVGTADRFYCRRPSAERFLAAVPQVTLLDVPGVDHMGLVMDQRARWAWKWTARWLTQHFSANR